MHGVVVAISYRASVTDRRRPKCGLGWDLPGSPELLVLGAGVAAQNAPSVPSVDASSTVATQQGGANRAVVVTDGQNSSIVGTAELAGLEIYDSSGKRTGSVPAGEAVGVDVRYGALPGLGCVADPARRGCHQQQLALLSVARRRAFGNQRTSQCRLASRSKGLASIEAARTARFMPSRSAMAARSTNICCSNRPPAASMRKLMRRLHVASTVEHCVADDTTGQLYVSEQAVGIWRFNAEPETEIVPVLIDAVRLGKITEEVGGLALYDGGDAAKWLIASNASAGQLYVYDHAKDDAYVGALTATSAGGRRWRTGRAFRDQLISLGRAKARSSSDDEDGSNYKIVPFGKIAQALGINAGSPQPLTAPVAPTFPIVHPTIETDPVASAADAADDPAIWANPANPAASWVIGTDKQGGLHVYDMQGKSRHFAADGKMNNVDLQDGLPARRARHRAGDRERPDQQGRRHLFARHGDRSAHQYRGRHPADRPVGPLWAVHVPRVSADDNYVFISDPDGLVRQWELVPTRVRQSPAKQVRDIKFSSQTEGCVADDRERHSLCRGRRYRPVARDGRPVESATPVAVDKVADNPKIKDDMEGVGIYDLGGGRGYLIVSSQGNNSYAVYRREGDHAYLGSFSVIADPAKGIDGISETDGLDVSSANLGPGFEHGAMIAQDGRNVLPVENQNFKFVPWSTIARSLNLEMRR